MPRASTKEKNKPTIVVKRLSPEGDEHHGGAWKVAYADFVTAMMAFFLLMWIINFIPDDTRKGLTNYFSNSPSGIIPTPSGAGGLFGGTTLHQQPGMAQETGEPEPRLTRPSDMPMDVDEEEGDRARLMSAGLQPDPASPSDASAERGVAETAAAASPANPTAERSIAEIAAEAARVLAQETEQRENQHFAEAIAAMRQALQTSPGTADVAAQVLFEITREGLRIHLTDAEERPMFALGSATPERWLLATLQAILPTIRALPNTIRISGHTDSRPFRSGDRSNWELSLERAIAIQRFLSRQGIPDNRFADVTGHADRQPLRPDTPDAAVNRRVSLLLLR